MMRVQVASAKVSRDKKGRKGGRLKVLTPVGAKWAGSYVLDTHGLSDAEVESRIGAIEVLHAKKSERFDGFRALCSEPLTVGGAAYRVTDCLLRDVGQPGGDVELSIYASRASGERIGRPWFPIVVAESDVTLLPSDEDIREMVARRIAEAVADEEENVEIRRKLNKFEKGGGKG